jgi:gliding motility-associated lipoprotein GldD
MKIKTQNSLIKLFFVCIIFSSCNDPAPVPKPPTYLNINFPDHSYTIVKGDCPYEFKLASLYNYKTIENSNFNSCIQEINLGPLNGSLYLYYIALPSKDSLEEIINFANDKVDEHKIIADKIEFVQIIDPKNSVFGTFFELKGNVATNFQFYLTDSSQNFVRGEVLLNCRPNYDSLRPSLDYLKVDLLEMVHNFKWRKY